jgi:hypothetical protein
VCMRLIVLFCLITSLAPDSANAVELNTDSALKCWLRFEEGTGSSAGDASGNSHPGTLASGASFTSGKLGGGVDLDGTDDCVVVSHHADLSPSNVTIALWVNLDTWSSTLTALASKQSGASPFPMCEIRKTNLATTLESNAAASGVNYSAAGSTPPTGAWHHVALTYDGDVLRLYQNGAQTGQNANPNGSLNTNMVNLWLGGNPSASGRHMEGKIDEFRFYDRSLSLSEVRSLHDFPRGYVPPEFHQTTNRMNGGFRND